MLYSERESGLVCFSKDRTNKRLNQVIVYIILYSPRNSKTMKRIIFDFWGNEDKSIQCVPDHQGHKGARD